MLTPSDVPQKNAILLHGKPGKDEYYSAEFPSASNSHWFPWLQKQLLVQGIAAQTPEMPNSWQPHYPTWKKEFERYDITPTTLLVGHSCGAGFIVRWLSEHKDVHVGRVVLVAPSLGKDWPNRDFFNFAIDPGLAARTNGLIIFYSNDDRPAIIETASLLGTTIKNATCREFSAHGHFTLEAMQTTHFPELLEALLKPSSRSAELAN